MKILTIFLAAFTVCVNAQRVSVLTDTNGSLLTPTPEKFASKNGLLRSANGAATNLNIYTGLNIYSADPDVIASANFTSDMQGGMFQDGSYWGVSRKVGPGLDFYLFDSLGNGLEWTDGTLTLSKSNTPTATIDGSSGVFSGVVPSENLSNVLAVKLVGSHASPYFAKPYSFYAAATSRTRHWIPSGLTSIGIGLTAIGGAGGPNQGELPFTNSFEIGASFEYTTFVGATNFIPLYFGGKQFLTVSNGMNYSDLAPMPASFLAQWGWFRVFVNRVASTNYTLNGERGTLTSTVPYLPESWGDYLRGLSIGTGEGVYYITDTNANPLTACLLTGGNIPASDNRAYAPSVIFGTCAASASSSVAIVGDSIGAGSTDYPDYGPGYIVRGLGTIPYVFPSISGEYAGTWASNNAPLRVSIANRADNVIIELGSNDIYNGINVSNSLQKLWSYFAGQGKRVYQTTIMPRSTSTDNWKTTTNQTVNNLNNFNTVRTNVNAWIRSTPWPLSGYIEAADAVESARDSGIWKAPETNVVSGTASGGSVITLVDSSKSWQTNQWAGYFARNITQGKWAQIAYNTSNTLSTPNSWACSPGDSYEIVGIYTIDGTHPSKLGHIDGSASIDPNVFKANKTIILPSSTPWK